MDVSMRATIPTKARSLWSSDASTSDEKRMRSLADDEGVVVHRGIRDHVMWKMAGPVTNRFRRRHHAAARYHA